MSDDQGATPESTPAETEPRKEDAPLGDAGQKALDAWKSRAKEAEARAKQYETKVSEYEEASASEVEKLTKRATKAEEKAADAQSRLLRFEVAAEKQVPSDYLDLLVGTTRDELEAKAEKIAQLAKSRTENEPEPDFDGGAREPAPEPKTPEQQANETFLGLLGIQANT